MTAHPTASPARPAVDDLPAQRAPGGGPAANDLVRQVRVGRQAIYDAQRAIVAYEVLFRSREPDPAADGSEGGTGNSRFAEQATSQVIASTFGTFGLEAISAGRPVFINFTRAFITGVLPIPVQPESVIVNVLDHVAVDHELLAGLNQLRDNGYRIALRDYQGPSGTGALLELADFVAIPVGSLPARVVPGLVGAVRAAGATTLATRVEDASTLGRALEFGFDLYQGAHLDEPVVLQGRALSPSQLVCVRLLNELAAVDAPIARIEQLVGGDPGLSLRLLRTANSVSNGARQEVTSLRQAIVLIGPRRLRSWVVLTLLEGGATRNASDDLWNVLARAYACQRLAAQSADLAFTVGLLSGAAQMLGTDPATVADTSGIGQQARAALVDGDGEAGRALSAVLAHEHDDLAAITSTGLMPFDVSRAYLESLSESLTLVHDLTGQ